MAGRWRGQSLLAGTARSLCPWLLGRTQAAGGARLLGARLLSARHDGTSGASSQQALKVTEWLAQAAPGMTQPRKIFGRWRRPLISARGQAEIVRRAIAAGVVELEPTKPFVPSFKGHKHERQRPAREAMIADKMKDMQQRVLEHREAKCMARREYKERERAREFKPPYVYGDTEH